MFNSNKVSFWFNLTSVILSLLITLFILISGKFLPPKLPLFYSLPWGDMQLGNHQQILIIPATITLITLFNLILSLQLHNQQIFFKRVLLSSSILIDLILTITFLKMISIFI